MSLSSFWDLRCNEAYIQILSSSSAPCEDRNFIDLFVTESVQKSAVFFEKFQTLLRENRDAESFKKLITEFGYSPEELATMWGSRGTSTYVRSVVYAVVEFGRPDYLEVLMQKMRGCASTAFAVGNIYLPRATSAHRGPISTPLHWLASALVVKESAIPLANLLLSRLTYEQMMIPDKDNNTALSLAKTDHPPLAKLIESRLHQSRMMTLALGLLDASTTQCSTPLQRCVRSKIFELQIFTTLVKRF